MYEEDNAWGPTPHPRPYAQNDGTPFAEPVEGPKGSPCPVFPDRGTTWLYDLEDGDNSASEELLAALIVAVGSGGEFMGQQVRQRPVFWVTFRPKATWPYLLAAAKYAATDRQVNLEHTFVAKEWMEGPGAGRLAFKGIIEMLVKAVARREDYPLVVVDISSGPDADPVATYLQLVVLAVGLHRGWPCEVGHLLFIHRPPKGGLRWPYTTLSCRAQRADDGALMGHAWLHHPECGGYPPDFGERKFGRRFVLKEATRPDGPDDEAQKQWESRWGPDVDYVAWIDRWEGGS